MTPILLLLLSLFASILATLLPRNRTFVAELSKWEPYCFNRELMGDRGEALSCINMLLKKGSETCSVWPSELSEFCFAGSTKILGSTESRRPENTPCLEVAKSVAWVVDNCKQGSQTGGAKLTTENMNLRVIVEKRIQTQPTLLNLASQSTQISQPSQASQWWKLGN